LFNFNLRIPSRDLLETICCVMYARQFCYINEPPIEFASVSKIAETGNEALIRAVCEYLYRRGHDFEEIERDPANFIDHLATFMVNLARKRVIFEEEARGIAAITSWYMLRRNGGITGLTEQYWQELIEGIDPEFAGVTKDVIDKIKEKWRTFGPKDPNALKDVMEWASGENWYEPLLKWLGVI